MTLIVHGLDNKICKQLKSETRVIILRLFDRVNRKKRCFVNLVENKTRICRVQVN